jgi:hypothetical protein
LLVRQLLGTAALGAALVPPAVGAHLLRRTLLPTWSGPPAVLADAVTALAVVLGAVELVGVVGLFRIVPTVLVCSALGVGLALVARRLGARPSLDDGPPLPHAPPERFGTAGLVAASVAVAAVAATWGARTAAALHHGMVSIDSLWYHLPSAARYAQSGSIGEIHHDYETLSGFFPNAADLYHALGMVLLDNDSLSPLLNLGWCALALLAAWCVGRPFGVSSSTTTGCALLLCAPGMVSSQPGSGYADVVGVALLLSSGALLVHAGAGTRVPTDPAALGVAALPLGIAVGTKWTFLPMAGALALGVLVLLLVQDRSRRTLAPAAGWLAPIVVLGCFSYVRNWVAVGSPMPVADLKLGPVGFARVEELPDGSASLSRFLLDGEAWREYFVPGFDVWFGRLWLGVVLLAAAGLVLAVVAASGRLGRMLGVAGCVALAGYLASPQVLTVFDLPVFFWANLRYLATAVAVGLVLLPTTRLASRRPVGVAVLAAELLLLGAAQLEPTLWSLDTRDLRIDDGTGGADAVAGLALGALVLAVGVALAWRARGAADAGGAAADAGAPAPVADARTPARRLLRLAPALAALAVVALGVLGVQRWYLDHRYASPGSATPLFDRTWQSWTFARDLDDERIGFRNTNMYFPLFGNDLTNHVEVVGGRENFVGAQPGPSLELTTCEAWRTAVNEAGYTYVVLYAAARPTGEPVAFAPFLDVPAGSVPGLPDAADVLPEVRWLASDPAATVALRAPGEVVIAIGGELDPGGCDAGAEAGSP